MTRCGVTVWWPSGIALTFAMVLSSLVVPSPTLVSAATAGDCLARTGRPKGKERILATPEKGEGVKGQESDVRGQESGRERGRAARDEARSSVTTTLRHDPCKNAAGHLRRAPV